MGPMRRHVTRMGADQAPDWPTGTEQGCLGTAMHAVHAIAPVCRGILG